MFSALLATKRQNSVIRRGPLVSVHPGGGKAFTLVELIATIAVVAMLAVALVVFIGGYIADAKRTADQQTLAVLNDALTRYKTQGGSLAALTSGASIGNVLTKLQTAVTWAGMKHQFLKTGTTYTAASIGAIGEGQRYRFTKYGSFADGSAVGSDILETVAAAGYDVGDEAAFDAWITQAMAETGTTNYLALTNPDTTDRFGIYARVANSGDKVRVWWGDGTTENFDSISTSFSTVIAKVFGSSAARTIVIVGDLGYIYSDDREELGGAGATYFGGDISTMTGLTYLSAGGNNTITGDISGLTGLTFLNAGGSNTLSGDVSGLTGLTHLRDGGSNTITGDVSGLTGLTYLSVHGSNTISGDVSGLTGLTYLSAWGSNTISGNISTMTGLTILSVHGSNTISGDVSGLTGLTFLSAWGNSSLNTASLLSITGSATGLSYFTIGSQYTLTQTQTDTILVNMDTNKGQTKPRSERYIDINEANHAAPSATGLAAKTNLVNASWTVNTN